MFFVGQCSWQGEPYRQLRVSEGDKRIMRSRLEPTWGVAGPSHRIMSILGDRLRAVQCLQKGISAVRCEDRDHMWRNSHRWRFPVESDGLPRLKTKHDDGFRSLPDQR